MAVGHFLLNQTHTELDVEPDASVLDLIRHNYRLTSCKEVCREGDCGACLVLLGRLEQLRVVYHPVASCLLPAATLAGCHIVTIEGLHGDTLNPIQQALVEHGGIQCGFCTPGIVLAMTAFFLNSPTSDYDAAVDAVAGNLCRCTGYSGIKRALKQLCAQFDLANSPLETRLQTCIAWRLIPPYFVEIPARMAALPDVEISKQKTDAVLVAGGTDLFVQRPAKLKSRKLTFLPTGNNHDPVRIASGTCLIAAETSIEQLRTSPLLQTLLPTISEDLKLLCSAPIRQRATIAGNLVNASPIADLSVLFLALDASVRLGFEDRQRKIRLQDFFIAYKHTACEPSERLLEISFPCPTPTTGFSFEKVSKREFLDIASVNSALSIRFTDGLIDIIHLSAGGVAPTPLYLSATCVYLHGKPISADVIVAAAKIAQTEIAPISDLRGSAAYKRLLLRQLIFAHFLKLFPQSISWEALHALD